MQMGKEEVPKEMLTPELAQWLKQYTMAKKVAQFAKSRVIGMDRVFQEATGMLRGLLANIPRRKVEELAQQPAEEE